MAEETKNTTISKTNTGFPDYLDFNKLRTEGIDYLGRLTGKIWTDYNVHDPGITILEVLCYALLDLGYRTNLPEADIFTLDPKDKSTGNNFFTPAQILACNPLTITDFRKLLIDIKGIKNAWLEVVTNEIEYLNGLYHVYIDLENDESKKKSDIEAIISKVKTALMAHRNLCEDFIDLNILCKQEIGVCADIELEETANAEDVYINVVEKLRGFFSPSPKFYTLQQLLDKQKSIEDIFAGRPYNITESHGFVDTEELEQLKLRKEIHLSDVYHAIFNIKGVKGISNLHLQNCKDNLVNSIPGWKYQIPENHVPEFSLACSGFQFNKNGNSVFVDVKKFEGLFSINFMHNGKVGYKKPSPYLDIKIPEGVYRSDLAGYYSIQNEFPKVYGIAEGGLPENVSPAREAQAYQLKAWLLFFDQFLANYLAQLKNIPSLFAMSSSDDESSHTYFSQQLTSVPDHQKLVRFNLDEDNNNILGTEGSILVLPVDKNELMSLIEQDKLKTTSIEDIAPFTFSTLAEQDVAISQLKNDLYFEQYDCEYIIKNNDCVFYYILTSSDEIALISKKYFKNIAEAKEHAASVKYIGTFDENYRSFITSGNVFSFDIELKLLSFTKYLQLIVEDKKLFYQRRQGFLDHLLARFAEQFTDYALLSFGLYDVQQSQVFEIKAKEKFLSHYDDLSSNRGRACNYLEDGWSNDNISGFEKKIKGITGIESWKRQSLCNFIVTKYDDQYTVVLRMAGTPFFSTKESYDTKEKALQEAEALFNAMKEKTNYQAEYIPHEKMYSLNITYDNGHKAILPFTYATEKEAADTANRLSGLFSEKDPTELVFVSSFLYTPELKDKDGNLICRSLVSYSDDEESKATVLKTIKKIHDPKQWQQEEKTPLPGKLHHSKYKKDSLTFIDVTAFKIDINNTIIGKPDSFTYDLLDKENTFNFRSVNIFSTSNQARKNAIDLLGLLADESRYQIFEDAGKFLIRILKGESIQAVCTIESDTKQDAVNLQNLILSIVKKHQYFIEIDKKPNRWKFNYLLGYQQNNLHRFESDEEFANSEEATQAATLFLNKENDLQLQDTNGEMKLAATKGRKKVPSVTLVSEAKNKSLPRVKKAVGKLLAEKKEIIKLRKSHRLEDFRSSIELDEVSRQGLYVYRLVDKDRVPAFFTKKFNSKNEATAAIKSLSNSFSRIPDYLQLCMGGDHITHKRKDSDGSYWYHYQLVSLNYFYTSGDPFILFESTKGYSSRQEAEQAFKDNYLQILHLAADADNYGNKISFKEVLIHDADLCTKSDSVVFIPGATLEDSGNWNDKVIQKLVALAVSYPIQMVESYSNKFYELFPCEKKKDGKQDTCKKEERYVYYFILRSGNEDQWQSMKFYAAVEEAWKEFEFFKLLLHYQGNYYADCDRCINDNQSTYLIYIREVLAESTGRFLNENQAWGEEGVQKFICITQSKDSFHTYQRKNGCCYSFYIACKDGFIYHPCKYDTPQKRDKVMIELYQSLKKQLQTRSWQIDDSGNNLLLLDEKGKPFAGIARQRGNNNYCNSGLIAQLAGDKNNYKEENGRIILVNDNNEILAYSIKENITLSEWKILLQAFSCHYPIVKTRGQNNDRAQYCIEIKLPGFNTCKEDYAEEKPCGCGNEEVQNDHDCYIAWKSKCCYATCTAAEQALQAILKILQNYEFYQPVFDCVCASYGISLHFEKSNIVANENITYYVEEANFSYWHDGEIVAINPQCYPNKETACEAADRAKELINREGMHLVEHILLRPRCFPDDRKCRQYSKGCDNKTDCEFIWKMPDDDPCGKEEDIRFIPGSDPYSFIATAILPAWPARFRKKENRELIEKIIYREAPAHILLRILWLAPHDLCLFESKFKNWSYWLALKKACMDGPPVCDFLEFLFDRNYECLEDCDVCEPCNEIKEQRQPCFVGIERKQNENEYLNQINEIYCWTKQNCGRLDQPKRPEISNRQRSKVVNARLTKYKATVEAVAEKRKDNPLVTKVKRFLDDPQPSYNRLSKLVTEVLQNRISKSTGSKPLTNSQVYDVLKSSISYWLDKTSMSEKEEDMKDIKNVVKKLNDNKIKTERIYNYWKFSELKKYETSLDEKEVKDIFMQKKK